MYRLAHISDPHIGPLPACGVTALMGKRLLGYLSWHTRRQAVHRREVLDALVADITDSAVDHVAVTGDLVNISLPEEFQQAGAWLQRLGDPHDVTIVPGNHDHYVPIEFARTWQHLAAYMSSDPQHAPPLSGFDGFPILRHRGPLALIGLSTAVPSGPGRAIGRLGHQQLARLRRLLVEEHTSGSFRTVLLHHPVYDRRAGSRKRLLDSDELRRILAEVGAELVLHGHDHRFAEHHLPGPEGTIPVVAVPSASALPSQDRPGAHYHVYSIERGAEGWQRLIELRGYDLANGRFARIEERALPVASAGLAATLRMQ